MRARPRAHYGSVIFRAFEARAAGHPWFPFEMAYLGARRVARGVYAETGTDVPLAAAALYRTPHAIGALESALHLHHFVAAEPPAVWLALPEHARKPSFDAAPLHAMRWRYPPHEADVCHVRICRGLSLPVFTLAKTAIDFLRLRNRLGLHHALPFVEAIVDLAVTSDELLASAMRNRALTLARRFLDRGPAGFLQRADGNPPRTAAVSS